MKREAPFICDKCGKVMPIDFARTLVLDMYIYEKRCKCGGKAIIKIR